jgi:hypothetical protein
MTLKLASVIALGVLLLWAGLLTVCYAIIGDGSNPPRFVICIFGLGLVWIGMGLSWRSE